MNIARDYENFEGVLASALEKASTPFEFSFVQIIHADYKAYGQDTEVDEEEFEFLKAIGAGA